MKAPPIILVLALVAGLGAVATPPSKSAPAPGASSLATLPPSPLATRMKQIRALLDDTFKLRDPASPMPDVRQNPFRIPGAPANASSAPSNANGGRTTPAPETEALRLRRLALLLAPSIGLVATRGQQMISYNSATYREGEMVRVVDPVTNAPVLLRLRKIDGKNVTFGLGSSDFTVAK